MNLLRFHCSHSKALQGRLIDHLEQGNKSVEEYAREFKVYAMKCGVNKDETQTLVRFSSQYLRVGLQK